MAAADEFLIDLFVTRFAIACSHLRGKRETVVFFLGLFGRRLVTIEASHALGCVLAHLKLMDDGVLLAGVAFGALAGGAHEVGAGLLNFSTRSGAVYQESSKNEREGDYQRNEDRTKWHLSLPKDRERGEDRSGQ